MSMNLGVLLTVVAAALYVAASVLAVAHVHEPAPARERDIMLIAVICSLSLVASLVVRGLRVGTFPAFGGYEAATWYALSVTVAYVYVGLRHEVLRTLSAILLPYLAIVVVLGIVASRAASPAAPPLHSLPIGIHVTAAFAGYGLFTLETVLAVAYLVQDRSLKRKHFSALNRRLPSLEMLDRAMVELIGVAFWLFTLSIGMGIFLAHAYQWGARWLSDPKAITTAATWVVYAVLFYLRRSADRHGRHLAYVAILGFVFVLLGFLGIHLVTDSVHDFGLQVP